MMIDTNKPKCPECGDEIMQMATPIVIDDEDGLVVECSGYCCRQWYKWYEHYSFKGHTGLEKSERIRARSS